MASPMTPGPMTPLPAGTEIGPYRTLAAAAEDGEWYKASDTRTGRVVAIRLLAAEWAQAGEMRQRLERDARLLASLNHPNIDAVFEIARHEGRAILVAEFLDGSTLAARLERGPIDWHEALEIAIPIADALDQAHRCGVLHGDLKPSNVVLTSGGPKLRGFGGAAWEPAAVPVSKAGSGAPATETRTGGIVPGSGSALNTLRYMAPEQLEGLEPDARTDIFGFGLLLHEMLTGKKTFDAKSRMLLISAITTADPESISRTRPAVPAAADHVIQVCLAKDPTDRWQTAHDLVAELRWIAQAGGETGTTGLPAGMAPAQRMRAWRKHAPLAAAVLLVAAAALPAALYYQESRQAGEFRFQVPTSDGPGLTSVTLMRRVGRDSAISADGRSMAFVTQRFQSTEPPALFVLRFGSVTPRRMPGSEEAAQPFWSPDGRFIAFVTDGKLKKLEASGGPPQELCDVADFWGGTWSSQRIILFGSTKGLYRVSAEGGKPELETAVAPGESGHFWPHFLPDGRRYLYTAWAGEQAQRVITAGTLGSKERVRVMAGESNATYAPPGYLLFHREDALYAQPFDWKKPALRGEPVRVADEVDFFPANGYGDFSVAGDGSLLYFKESNTPTVGRGGIAFGGTDWWRLTWSDRSAKVLPSQGPDGPYLGFEISPDGKRIAVHRHDEGGGDILVIEPDNSVRKLTFDASHHNSSPVWSPTGDRIAYSAFQKGKWGIYQTLSNGSGTEELLYESDLPKAPMSWSPDGKNIVFWVEDPRTAGDLWVLAVEARKAEPLIATRFDETHAQISPDGKWIAYTSNLTGRNEVHVQPFPSGSGHWQVSFHGGDWPRWRGDSKELFYHAIAGNLNAPAVPAAFVGTLFSVAVTANGGEFVPSNPTDVLRDVANNVPHSGGIYQTYAVSQDGQRILNIQYAGDGPAAAGRGAASVPADPGGEFMVARNWVQGLKK